jgi:hypothetical protein
MKQAHWIGLSAAAAVLAYLLYALRQAHPTGGFNQPQAQPVPDSDLNRLVSPHSDHPLFCQPEDHHAGYVYTPHRYPRFCGGDVSAVIHHGFSPMRIPNIQDMQWLIAPPSEVNF